ncbi:unnamed protein product, partial [Symbiodinium microadriaticum]
ELAREESLELRAVDLANKLSEPLQVSAYRLSFAIFGRKLEDEVLKDLWPEEGDLGLQVLVRPIDKGRCPLMKPGQILEVRRDGIMKVAVTFELGHVLEHDADKYVVHKVVVKDPADFFPSPQVVFLYDEETLSNKGSKTVPISLLGPPSSDLGRRTLGRSWPYGLSELFLHFSNVYLETAAGAGKAVRTSTRPLRAARQAEVMRLLAIFGGAWLLHVGNVMAALWLSRAAFLAGGSLYGALTILSLAFPGLLWQMLCRPGRLVWLQYSGNRSLEILLFICTPLGFPVFVHVVSFWDLYRLSLFLWRLCCKTHTGHASPVDLKHWYIYEAFREDTRIFGDAPRAFLCAVSWANRPLGVLAPETWPYSQDLVVAEVVAGASALASCLLGLIPARRHVSRKAKEVVRQHILQESE